MNELLAGADLGTADVSRLIHGTTLVTNAIIERRGAKLALLTTRGFRDILEMGSEQRYDIHDLFLEFPEPLAPRALRREVDERMDRDGDVVVALDLDQVRREAADLAAAGVEAIAVCFLHAYKNPAHERLVRDILVDAYPQIAVSLSSDVQPELREYERASTTTANAYVQPLMKRYVRPPGRGLRRSRLRRAIPSHAIGGAAWSRPRRRRRIRSAFSNRARRGAAWRPPSSAAGLANPTSSPSTWAARRPRHA